VSLDILTKFERELWEKGVELVAGVDEVGRGALAGPMVVAAVVINKKHLFEHILGKAELAEGHDFYNEIRDSKKLSPKKRRAISEKLLGELYFYSIVEIPHSDIDKLGISKCTQISFYNAVKGLHIKPEHVLTDTFEIRGLAQHTQTNITQGDNKSVTIAAASIVAKVYRDNLMVDLHEKYDKYKVYGFNQHKGYGTLKHREAIKKHGFSDIHRKTFKVK
jgi:ribonuclease HII